MANLVTDATPWLAYFSGGECPVLEVALASGVVRIPPMVATELLANPLSPKDKKDLLSLLEPLIISNLDIHHWQRAADLKARLDQEGRFISARDAHVIQCALDQSGALLSSDALFLQIQKTTGVKVQIW
jgi:predicted nucleic acid-binding protein